MSKVTDTKLSRPKKVTDVVKVGDEYIVLPGWDRSLVGKIGIVTKVKDRGFDITWDECDERGPFRLNEIGDIVRKVTKLDKALK